MEPNLYQLLLIEKCKSSTEYEAAFLRATLDIHTASSTKQVWPISGIDYFAISTITILAFD